MAELRPLRSLLRLALLMAGLLLGCGGPGGPGPAAPDPKPVATAPTPPAPSGSAPAPPAPDGATAQKPSPTPPSPRPPPIKETAMAVDLLEIGLDPAALPPLNKLSPDQLRKVMKTFTRSLGVTCNGCHDTRDFRAPTRNKKIATHMWNDFTRVLATTDNKAVYCDSCHGGQKALLDRKDLQLLSTWMQEQYVDKLRRADGKDHGCESCHGDPIEPKIFTTLWK